MPLSVSSGPGAWISDFVHSSDSRFKGKSKEKRRQMALAAFYSKRRGNKESNSLVSNAMDLLELGMINTNNPYSKSSSANTSVPPTTPATSTASSPAVSTSGMSTLGMNPSTPPSTPSMAPTTSLGQSPLDQTGVTNYVTGGSSSASTTSALTTGAASLLGTQSTPPSTDMGSSTYSSTKPKTLSNVSSGIGDSLIEIDSAIRVCPNCGKTGTDPYMSQNHFSNCKHQKADKPEPTKHRTSPAEL